MGMEEYTFFTTPKCLSMVKNILSHSKNGFLFSLNTRDHIPTNIIVYIQHRLREVKNYITKGSRI